jgi:dihydroneopterin aldolase
MTTYLLPKARNTVTGETVKAHDLTGARIQSHQRRIAETLAEQLADKMTARTGDQWQAEVVSYTAKA